MPRSTIKPASMTLECTGDRCSENWENVDGSNNVKALLTKPVTCPSITEFGSPSVVSLPAKADPGDHFNRTSDAIMANRTPPNKKLGAERMGAKAVKSMEKISTAYTLNPEDATNYRA